jgi:hypothetical protein
MNPRELTEDLHAPPDQDVPKQQIDTIQQHYQQPTNSDAMQAKEQFQRPTYPAVNPADQNLPCNTLYVDNLPANTSEGELMAVFSKQRGFKRLAFRTKQNGPMCLVEFKDTSFAIKALDELYGYKLQNSVNDGIRLSFSKNPLGIRNSQEASAGPSSFNPSGHSFSNFEEIVLPSVPYWEFDLNMD